METIKINRFSEDGGYESAIAIYEGKFSAVYCLCLYICQNIWHVCYLNKRNIEHAKNKIFLGKYNRAAYFYVGDATYSAMATDGRDAITGEFGSKYDYEPNYPTK